MEDSPSENKKIIPISTTKEYKRDVQKAFREKHADKLKQKNKERYQKKKQELNELRDKIKQYEATRN